MARVSHLLTAVLLGLPLFVLAPVAQGQPQISDEENMRALSEDLDRQVDRYVEWLSRMYQLSPEQQKQVRTRLGELKAEHMKYGPNEGREMEAIQKEMRFYIEEARQGKTLDKQKVQELQDRLVAVVEKAPMTFNHVIIETEKLLPPEQIKAGRQRQQEFNERMSEMLERQKLQAPDPVPDDTALLTPYMKQPDDQPGKLPPPPIPIDQPTAPAGGGPAGPVAAPKPLPTPEDLMPPPPPDEWTRYVQEFIARYQLDERQKQQSWQIHGELVKRAGEYRQAHMADFEAIKRIQDAKLGKEELAALNKPIQDMFIEMKTRLDNIPTEAQRRAAEAKAPTTRKAAASAPASAPASRPSVAATTRPAPAGAAAR